MDVKGAKGALRLLWTDTATISEYHDYDDEDESTQQGPVAVLENVPCKLSFQSIKETSQTETAAVIAQAAKLFIDPGLDIKPGSKITIARAGRVFEFKQSGLPAVFTGHQEIILVPLGDYA